MVPKKDVIVLLPYIGLHSNLITKRLKSCVNRFYSFVNVKVIFQNTRRVQFLAEQFWSRWRNEYLINLSLRQKWFTPRRNLKIGDVVILQDEVPRNDEWPLGMVMETSRNQEGLVRAVKVKLGYRNLQK